MVLLRWAVAQVDVDEECVVALGLGGGIADGLVGEGFEDGGQVFPEDTGFGNRFDVGFIEKVAQKRPVELNIRFHEDVFPRLHEIMESATPEAGTGVYIDNVASFMAIERGADILSNIIYTISFEPIN